MSCPSDQESSPLIHAMIRLQGVIPGCNYNPFIEPHSSVHLLIQSPLNITPAHEKYNQIICLSVCEAVMYTSCHVTYMLLILTGKVHVCKIYCGFPSPECESVSVSVPYFVYAIFSTAYSPIMLVSHLVSWWVG